MPKPEQRFEVPPEYAEVYERAYRRAYEEGQGSDGRPAGDPAPGRPGPEQRWGIPQQRSGSKPPSRHRANRPAGSLRRPLIGAVAALVALLGGAFLLGRTSALPESIEAGGSAGSPPTAAENPSAGASSPNTSAQGSRPARILRARSTCTAVPTTRASGRTVAYGAENVVDDDPATVWRCEGLAVGQVLTFGLAPGTRVVQVGIAQGGAGSSRANQITRVAWNFGGGKVVEQSLGNDRRDHSMRTVVLDPTETDQIRLKLVGIRAGERDVTAIRRVQIRTPD